MGRTNRHQKSDFNFQKNYKKKERKRNERREFDRAFNQKNIQPAELNKFNIYEEYEYELNE